MLTVLRLNNNLQLWQKRTLNSMKHKTDVSNTINGSLNNTA